MQQHLHSAQLKKYVAVDAAESAEDLPHITAISHRTASTYVNKGFTQNHAQLNEKFRNGFGDIISIDFVGVLGMERERVSLYSTDNPFLR